MKKRVLLTVNPRLVEGSLFSTTRGFITALSRRVELLVLPVSGYDFSRGTVRAFRRLGGGRFEELGTVKPEGDLWIVYSDGFDLDHLRLGFRRRRDHFDAQMEFHRRHLDSGAVGLMVNTPEAEARTLKSWLAALDFGKTKVIPTHLFKRFDELYDFQKSERCVVAKPIWGGGSFGVRKLADEAAVGGFRRELDGCPDMDISDYCFQVFRSGDEKRLWFVGGEFVGGRRYKGRETPWSGWASDFRLYAYNKKSGGLAHELEVARRLCSLAGLGLGCVDFIGDEINEINGAGTVLTTFQQRKLVIDVRPSFVEYFVRLAESL
jgi:glutathione synthase/RimK-type ligase-like ATP-grasp enzyme